MGSRASLSGRGVAFRGREGYTEAFQEPIECHESEEKALEVNRERRPTDNTAFFLESSFLVTFLFYAGTQE